MNKAKNAKRVKRVKAAIKPYLEGEDMLTDAVIIDVLADMRHLCAKVGIDFDNCNRIAAGHFMEESRIPEES